MRTRAVTVRYGCFGVSEGLDHSLVIISIRCNINYNEHGLLYTVILLKKNIQK